MGNDEPIAIALADLRAALARVLDAAEEQFGPVVDLEADYYWSLAAGDAFDLSKDPSVVAGQLSDDVAEVRDLLAREEDEVVLWHDLEHVTGILLRIAGLAQP